MTRRAPKRWSFELTLAAGMVSWTLLSDAGAQIDWKKDWERSLQEARKEGKLVAGIPARPELRIQLEAVFKPRFGIDMELLTARGPQNAGRIASEYSAGVKYFDVFMGGSGTYDRSWDGRAIGAVNDPAGSQRCQELVGRAYMGR